MPTRPPAVSGAWYPADARRLTSEVEAYLARTDAGPQGDVVALIAPHAGLMYSGPVAAHAYRLLKTRVFDVAVLVGPSHFGGFAGVAVYPEGAFASPLGSASIDGDCAAALLGHSGVAADPAVHGREHSLEMQLPFLRLVAPSVPIVPLLMGSQTADTMQALAHALEQTLRGRNALLIASTDLSHYHDARMARVLDGQVIDLVERFDAEGLQEALERRPDHACGGGPTVSVMLAARALGARHAVVLNYADSGDVSGDKSSVVGYLAAAFGTFEAGAQVQGAGVVRRGSAGT